MKNEEQLIEELAELCHEQWSDWMEYLFSKCKKIGFEDIPLIENDVHIPIWAVKRWTGQMKTSYKDLSEEEKESDRIEARKFIELLKGKL